jgi:predicted nucleotidyltransferase component of viral defense system
LASIEALAAMKVNTLFLRAKYRDYYDLYFIVKERQLSLKTLFELSQKIVAGLTFKLMASALIFVDDIEDDAIDHLQPVQKISKYEIRDFFQKKITEFIKK